PRPSPPFPYTTLFRSGGWRPPRIRHGRDVRGVWVLKAARLLRRPMWLACGVADHSKHASRQQHQPAGHAKGASDARVLTGDKTRSEEHTSELQSLTNL